MSFAWPGLLWGLLLVPLAVAAYLFVQRRRIRYAVRFTNLALLANVAPRTPGWRRHLAALCYLLALTALLLGLARPQTVLKVPKEEATVVLVLDVSGSMNATDVRPTRLVAAQQAAKSFAGQVPPRFRLGVVAFSTTAQTVAEPTTDRAAIRDAIDSLQAQGGTAMGDAIDRALADVRDAAPASGTPKTHPPVVLLLLSDGFNTVGSAPLDAAGRAKARGIPIFTVALGTPDGMVDVPDNTGQVQRVPVPPDQATLRQVAELTGGRFFSAPSSGQLRSIYNELGSRIGYTRQNQEVTVVFTAAGLLLLVAGGTLSLLLFNRLP